MTHYLHHVPGRVRVRAPGIKRNPVKATAVKARLKHVAGVAEVDVRPVTGSITVLYDTDVTSMPDILAHLREMGHAPAPVPAAQAPNRATVASGPAISPHTEKAAKFVAGMALEKVLERSATALIAAIV
jgi:copper chaperone CopZ